MTSILFISRCPPYPLHFGDRLIIWHLARELAKQGHMLDLLALTQYETDADKIHHYESFFRTISLFPERQRTPLMYLRRFLGQHHPQQSDATWQPDLWRTIEEKLAEQDYDLVHLFGGVQVYEFAHLLQGLPTVITPYESYSLYLKRAMSQSSGLAVRIQQLLARQFEKWMFTPFDQTVVLTDEDKSELLRLNPQLEVTVIPNGIDLTAFQPTPANRDAATCLFVGNYAYPPNHDAALLLAQEIFPQIQKEIPNAKLQLVGNAPSKAMLALQSEAIEVTGRVPSVQPYLNQATVFVCPLRVGAGIKNKVLEALAMGLPTVATPLSIEGIDVQHGQHVLVANVDNIASSVVDLLKNPTLQAQLSRQSIPFIQRLYSWHAVATQYQALYQKISDN